MSASSSPVSVLVDNELPLSAAGKSRVPQEQPLRHWYAGIELKYEFRREKTVLVKKQHVGPLHVQRPFYPEKGDCCHTYLLHPPGGLVVGDHVEVRAHIGERCATLLTTPSAGKVYRAKGVPHADKLPQRQTIALRVDADAVCEWLPQETIIFNGANAQLHTRIDLNATAKFIGWDVVRLGRAASGELFDQGNVEQKLELWRDGRLQFMEKNCFAATDDFQTSLWGLQQQNTFGTMIATTIFSRDQIDVILEQLDELEDKDVSIQTKKHWALTQKADIFIARYLGSSIIACKAGYGILWDEVRKNMLEKEAVTPRIWNT